MAASSKKDQFPHDAGIEEEFRNRGWSFRTELNYQLSRLEVVEECQVRGLTDRADPSIVTRYATAMAAGAKFPPGIVATVPKGERLVDTIIDMHHRKGSAERIGLTTYPVYVLTGVEPLMLKSFALRQNRKNGKELSDTEALAAVGQLVASGMSREVIARETGLSRAKIDRAEHAYKFQARVEQMDLGLTDDEERRLERIGVTARATMARKLEHEPVFEETLKLVLDTAMTGSEATALTKQVSQSRSDAEALALLKTERSLRSEQITRIAAGFVADRVSAVQQFRMHAGALLGLDVHEVIDQNASTQDGTHKIALQLQAFARDVVEAYGDDPDDPPAVHDAEQDDDDDDEENCEVEAEHGEPVPA